MKQEGLSNKLSTLLGETSDELLVARAKLTRGVAQFEKNTQNINALESAVNSLSRYDGDRTRLAEIENNLQEELRKHLEVQAKLMNKLPDIQLAEDSAIILKRQETTISGFARFWKSGTPVEAWKVARKVQP